MKRFILLLLAIITVCVLVTACGNSDVTTENTNSTENTTSAIQTTEGVVIEPGVPTLLPYEVLTVPENGIVEVNSASVVSGTLLRIDDYHPYQYKLSSLKASHKIQDHVLKIPEQNLMILYGNTSQKYLLKSSKLFYKIDAFTYLDNMLTQLSEDSGQNCIQIVNAYMYSDPSTLVNEYVSGYSVALNIFHDEITYSIDSSEFSFDYKGRRVTYLDWFIENCNYYGFIYTGAAGNDQLATFQFVGVAHAFAMMHHDITSISIYNLMIKLQQIYYVEEKIPNSDEIRIWYISYHEASKTEPITRIELPAGSQYIISGDNETGFIIAHTLVR